MVPVYLSDKAIEKPVVTQLQGIQSLVYPSALGGQLIRDQFYVFDKTEFNMWGCSHYFKKPVDLNKDEFDALFGKKKLADPNLSPPVKPEEAQKEETNPPVKPEEAQKEETNPPVKPEEAQKEEQKNSGSNKGKDKH